MEIVTTIAALRQKLSPRRRAGQTIGFVPTMGYLHQGHLSLVGRAKSENDVTVVSIFVNPLQFGRNEDLEKYPRDLARDSAMLEDAGVDYLFAPGVEDMYPEPMQTVVDLPKLGSELEGEARPGHFAGVATVVTKLFNIVQPDAAYFGEKDWQQLMVVRRLVRDLEKAQTNLSAWRMDHVRLVFAVHFTHPDEFLAKNAAGEYIANGRHPERLADIVAGKGISTIFTPKS